MSDSSIFVFGSNLAGRHGAGAAKFALKNHGAIYGQGKGLQGNSYAIPTKGYAMEVLSLDAIRQHVSVFKNTARHRPDLTFNITPIGCGFARCLMMCRQTAHSHQSGMMPPPSLPR